MLAWASHSEWRFGAAALALLLAAPSAHAAEPVFTPDIAPASEFPNPNRATRKEGLFVPPSTVRLLTPGMTKRQVTALLGVPHFQEGMFGVRRWNYLLDFYTGTGTEYRVCRLQMHYDRKMRLEKLAWSDGECRDLAYAPAAAPVSVPRAEEGQGMLSPVAAAPQAPAVTLYFDFDKADVRDDARRALASFVSDHGGRGFAITGFTDSVGQEAYNDRLSLMRADAVSKLLVDMGVPLSAQQISGAGERSPAQWPERQPDEPMNRRVVVRVMPDA